MRSDEDQSPYNKLSGTTDNSRDVYTLPKPYMNRTRKPETSFLGFMSTEIEKLDVKADARRTSMGFGTKDYDLAENAI
jgi:hypothetical protein